MDKNLYIIKKFYLAQAMCYLGFRYVKFKDGLNQNFLYGFEDTDEFRQAMLKLTGVKKELYAARQ